MDTMICNECENEAFDEGEDGFFYCQRCGVQSQGIIQTDFEAVDIYEVAWTVFRVPTNAPRRSVYSVYGRPPASKWTIEMLPSVAMVEKGECVICLEECSRGDMGTELPCKHKYHFECVKKWLKIHATCPQCRYKMPLEGEELWY